jgi:hypothetical protein
MSGGSPRGLLFFGHLNKFTVTVTVVMVKVLRLIYLLVSADHLSHIPGSLVGGIKLALEREHGSGYTEAGSLLPGLSYG